MSCRIATFHPCLAFPSSSLWACPCLCVSASMSIMHLSMMAALLVHALDMLTCKHTPPTFINAGLLNSGLQLPMLLNWISPPLRMLTALLAFSLNALSLAVVFASQYLSASACVPLYCWSCILIFALRAKLLALHISRQHARWDSLSVVCCVGQNSNFFVSLPCKNVQHPRKPDFRAIFLCYFICFAM